MKQPVTAAKRRKRFPKRPCPVCEGLSSKRLFRQSFERLATATVMDGYDVVICRDCGAGFADDIPPQSAFDRYYRDLSKYEEPPRSGSGRLPVEPRFRDVAAQIAEFVPSAGSRILEIGSAVGGLLKALHDLGFHNLLGADPSPACVRAAREFYGIPGFAATVFTIPPPEEPFDFLILTGVMEHIRDLDAAVDQFRRLLGPAGRVYFEVPDASRYQERLDAPFQEFSVEHINYFSRTSLINLMQARGFRLLQANHVVRPLHEVTCPEIYAVFEVENAPLPFERDTETEAGLRAYIQGCTGEDARIRAAIQRSIQPGEHIIVWGVGTHTLRLLAAGGFDPATIALFVDSNPKYQHQQLRGVPIVAPNEIRSRTEPILISSRSSQQEIHDQIRHGLRLNNPLILLYGGEGKSGRLLDSNRDGAASLEKHDS